MVRVPPTTRSSGQGRAKPSAPRRPGEVKLIISPVPPAAPGSAAAHGQIKPTAAVYGAVAEALGPKGLGFGRQILIDYMVGLHAGLHGKRPPAEFAGAQHKAIEKLIEGGRLGWANPPEGPGAILVEVYTGTRITGPDGKDIARAAPIVHPSVPPISFAQYGRHFQTSEGVSQHMYLDDDKRVGDDGKFGNVTIGIGHFIRDVAAAVALLPRLERRRTVERSELIERAVELAEAAGYRERESADVTEFEVARDFFTLTLQNSGGRKAEAYEKYTTLDLKEGEDLKLYEEDVLSRLEDAKDAVADNMPFEKLPQAVQLVVTDLVFQVGKTGFQKSFPKFQDAIRRRDWLSASVQANVNDENFERNQKKRDLLWQLYLGEPFFVRSETKSFVEVLINRQAPRPILVPPTGKPDKNSR